MKLTYIFFSISCVFIILFSTSCNKDSLITGPPACDTCTTRPPIVTLDTLFINDSSWVRQSKGVYQSDISTILNKLGKSPDKVYSMYVVSGGFIEILPDIQASFMNGVIYSSVYLSDDGEAFTITFAYLDKHEYYGQMPLGGSLPFSSIEIEILLRQ